MYNLSAYYIARTVSTLPLDLLYPSVFLLITYWMGGLRQQVRITPWVKDSFQPVPIAWYWLIDDILCLYIKHYVDDILLTFEL
jgi:hypothetical protein